MKTHLKRLRCKAGAMGNLVLRLVAWTEESHSVSGNSSCGSNLGRAPVVLGTGAGQRIFDARSNVALWLAADCGQLGNDQIARALEHALFAKRKGLTMAQIGKMLEHISHFKDVAGAHLF